MQKIFAIEDYFEIMQSLIYLKPFLNVLNILMSAEKDFSISVLHFVIN